MKNLLYKEFRISVHYLVYIFLFGFSFFYLIPNYPVYVSTIYVCASYSILFLGANKGQTTNDLFFTCLLPIRKKDAVKARVLTITVLQIVSLLLLLVLSPISMYLYKGTEGIEYVGLGAESMIALIGLILIGYSINDLIFVPWFYKTGKNIIWPSLVSVFSYAIFCMIFITALPTSTIEYREAMTISTGGKYLYIQLGILLIGILIYVLSKFLIYNVSSKRLEKIDL